MDEASHQNVGLHDRRITTNRQTLPNVWSIQGAFRRRRAQFESHGVILQLARPRYHEKVRKALTHVNRPSFRAPYLPSRGPSRTTRATGCPLNRMLASCSTRNCSPETGSTACRSAGAW